LCELNSFSLIVKDSFQDLDGSPTSMKARGYLRGIGFSFQFENLCNRSEDGFTSMVSLLTIHIRQLAGPFCKSRDSLGLDLIFH